ncbi:MAG: ABC transporter ATP-binding protein [Candidatus Marinimicrobia bacterium]|nr:ABC transporter ATP-binding protein [Candidatus Neomarinimicrobiota bacterium]
MVALSLLSSILFVMLNAFSIWMVSSLISTIMNPEGSHSTPIINAETLHGKLENLAVQLVGTGSQLEQLGNLCIILVVAYILKNIFFYLNNIAISFVQNRMIMDIRNQLFSHLQKLPISFFNKNKSGELTSIIMNDVSNMRVAFTQSIQSLINEPISILVLLGMLLIISTKLTLYALITVPVSAFIITKLGQSIRRKAKRSSLSIAGLMNILQETIGGIRIVKAFVMEKFEIQKFLKENKKYFSLTFKQENMKNLTTPINDLIGVSVGVWLLWVGGREVLVHGTLTPDGFIRFIIYLFAMLQPARKLGNVNAQIQVGLASAARVFSITDVQSDIREPEDPISIHKLTQGVSFKKVSFQYENSSTPSVKDISLSIERGEVLALVGSSGAGKTTIADLIPRYYDVSKGSIEIDSIDIRSISTNQLRKLMGIVSQDTILFNDSIAHNIKYGQPEADLDAVIKAAEAANAAEFIADLPEGYDTIIGEKGTRLSGGQRQRISIARAILKNPDILILDEATSALDTESERKVQEAIDNLVKDRTVIVIAHRLSTITKADRIIVLDKGEIVESGTHTELLERKGKYHQLYQIQFAGDEAL